MAEKSKNKATTRQKQLTDIQNSRSYTGFAAAQYGNMLDLNETVSINQDIRGGLNTLRRRARSIVQNDGIATGIITNYQNNIVGPRGITLSVQGKDTNGALDTKANARIEQEWEKWSKYGNCTVEGNTDFVKTKELILKTVAVDGECLISLRRGEQFGKWNFQLEVLPADQLDENYFAITDEGNVIFQGVELNDYGKPIAYHIFQHNRWDPMLYNNRQNTRIRVPASEIIHLFDVQSPKQVRGVSWFASALLSLHHCNLLQQTELQMSRIASLKQVIYTIDKPDEFTVDDELIEAAQMINKQLSPGAVEILPPGMSVVTPDMGSPNTNLTEFKKTILRDVSAAMGVSYNAIAKDLESISYSSARFGAMEDRVSYQSKQRWFINTFVNRVYEEWLAVQFMTGTIPFNNYEKFCNVKWNPRGWQSVDPQKDTNANAVAVLLGIKSRSEICSETGRDYAEVIQEQVQEEVMRQEAYKLAGLELPPNSTEAVKLEIAEMMANPKHEAAEDTD